MVIRKQTGYLNKNFRETLVNPSEPKNNVRIASGNVECIQPPFT